MLFFWRGSPSIGAFGALEKKLCLFGGFRPQSELFVVKKSSFCLGFSTQNHMESCGNNVRNVSRPETGHVCLKNQNLDIPKAPIEGEPSRKNKCTHMFNKIIQLKHDF